MSENADVVEAILGAKTLYDVLSLDKTCTDADIKRSYRKIAVKVHPDRCKHPKATEAFQKMSHAYQTLSDPDKRAHYDRFGDRPEPQPGMHPGGQFYGNHYRYEGEISPEEIFAAFFGANPGNVRFTHFGNGFNFQNMNRPRHNFDHGMKPNWGLLIYVIPIVLVYLMSAFSGGSRTESKWARVIHFDDDIDERQYQVMKSTKMKKQFGVPRSWLKQQRDYGYMRDPGKFYDSLKKEADSLWISQLQQKCKVERSNRRRYKPACDELDKAGLRMY